MFKKYWIGKCELEFLKTCIKNKGSLKYFEKKLSYQITTSIKVKKDKLVSNFRNIPKKTIATKLIDIYYLLIEYVKTAPWVGKMDK